MDSSAEAYEEMWLFEHGGRGFVRSDSHIELWRAGAGVDTFKDEDARVCKYVPDGICIEEGWIEA